MSCYGSRRGVPDYDSFRTGLTFREVRRMMSDRRHRRRNGVLGFWHQLKKEAFFYATGIALAFILGCGSITEIPGLRTDASEVSAEVNRSQGDASEVAPSSPDAATAPDADASPALPACQWSATMPHAVEHRDAGGACCHYVDSVGRPDGWLTGCQVDGLECLYPC